MIKIFTSPVKITAIALASIFISQPVLAAGKIKCWRNNEGVRECGTYVPPEFSQKRTETRNESGRVIEVEKRAKTKEEIAEIQRQEELRKEEEKKLAEQKKQDDILLKTFSTERDILLLRDSKVNVIEGILTVTKGNNKALRHKLERLQKQAANIERRGKTPPENILAEIKDIEARINKNKASIKEKRDEQQVICKKFAKDLEHFRELKNGKNTAHTYTKNNNNGKQTRASMICDGKEMDADETASDKTKVEAKAATKK